MVNNKTAKTFRGGSIFNKTRFDRQTGNVVLAVSPKNKLSNSVDVFKKRNKLLQYVINLKPTPELHDTFYKIGPKETTVTISNNDLLLGQYRCFRSIVYMDQNRRILFPKDFASVMSSTTTQVYEVEICFEINDFNTYSGVFKHSSYAISVRYLRKIREIKIDRGYIYHGIEMDSVMSYNSWEPASMTASINYTYDTFWFNLMPIVEKQLSLIIMETQLLTPKQYDKERQIDIQETNAIIKRIFNGKERGDMRDRTMKRR